MNISIFGDSVTWGAYLPFRGSWGNLLRNYLEKEHSDIALYDLGIDTETTKGLLVRFDVEAEARKSDLIIFAIGINDSLYRVNPDNFETDKETFKKNVEELSSKASQYTNKIMFVGLAKGSDKTTVPLKRSSTGKCYTKENAKDYNNILKEFCEAKNIPFANVLDKLTDEDFDDGVHPNFGGHQKIFEEVRRVIQKLLS